jgi:hypothetical protein
VYEAVDGGDRHWLAVKRRLRRSAGRFPRASAPSVPKGTTDAPGELLPWRLLCGKSCIRFSSNRRNPNRYFRKASPGRKKAKSRSHRHSRASPTDPGTCGKALLRLQGDLHVVDLFCLALR